MKKLLIPIVLFALSVVACEDAGEGTTANTSYLFTSASGLTGALRSGDVIRVVDGALEIHNILSGRDTSFAATGARNVIQLTSGGGLALTAGAAADEQRLWKLDATTPQFDSAFLTQEPFSYQYLGKEYWASFEPSFTGFPEYTRDGSRDFVNRLTDWSATAPGLEFSEYRVVQKFGQPLIVLSERERGQYLEDQIILVDSVGTEAFRGLIVSGDNPGGDPVEFTRTDGLADGYPAQDFVDEVNSGFSRSYLLLDRDRRGAAAPTNDKRLPRRSFIDPGDLGEISASFLDDGSVMFLSDDHIVLQGSYVLDLDKGLLTVTDETGASYRIFLDTNDGISFTVPVSVVELQGGRLIGEDNYLRIAVES